MIELFGLLCPLNPLKLLVWMSYFLFFRRALKFLPPYFVELLGPVLPMGIFQLPGGIPRLSLFLRLGKNYFEAKSFRPISLTSFLLKAIEKLVDR